MNNATLVCLGFTFMIFSSCQKEDTVPIEIVTLENNCVFVQDDDRNNGLIDETERAIMNQCDTNSLCSKVDIASNLIGEWKLIGHGEGWIIRLSQPCGYISIGEDELVFDFENGYRDTITTHDWEIEELNNGFALKTTPMEYALSINQFCDQYMYFDHTPLDGNMYLYEKVE